MALEVLTAGPCLVRTGTGVSSALEDLGYTVSQVRVISQPYFLDVPGDENGGPEGPPIEIQNMGQMDIIRCEFSKFDAAVWDKIVPFIKGGVAGEVGTVGQLVFAGSKFFRVLVLGTNFTRNYVRCIPRQPQEIGVGTKYSTLIIEFEAHKDATDLVWDDTTT